MRSALGDGVGDVSRAEDDDQHVLDHEGYAKRCDEDCHRPNTATNEAIDYQGVHRYGYYSAGDRGSKRR